MFSNAFRSGRKLLSHTDMFGTTPTLTAKDKDKTLSLTIISSLLFYTLTVILLNREISNLFDQSATDTVITTDSANTEVNWSLGRDLNLTIRFQGVGDQEGQLWIVNGNSQVMMDRLQEGNTVLFGLKQGSVLMKGWDQTGEHYRGIRVQVRKNNNGKGLMDRPYTVTLQIKSFEKDMTTPKRSTFTFNKKFTSNKSVLSLSLPLLVLTQDNSSSPYPTPTTQSGLLPPPTSQLLTVASSPTLLTISLSPLSTLHLISSFKLHRYISNIGNFLTTMVIMIMFVFIEFNFMNKYTRVSREMYVVKYQQEGKLVYQAVDASIWDWTIPARRAFRVCYGIKERLKIKAVKEVKKEFDVGCMVKRVRTLEKMLQDQPIQRLRSSMKPRSQLSIPSTVPSSSISNSLPSSIPSRIPSSISSLPSTSKFSSLLSLSSSSSSNADPNTLSTLSHIMNQKTIRQFSRNPTEIDDSGSSMVNQSVSAVMAESEVIVRAREGKHKRRECWKRIWKWFAKGVDAFLTEIDFFAYSVNFNYDQNRSEVKSEVSGIFTLLAVWFTFAFMFIDIISFAKSDHLVSLHVGTIDTCEKDLIIDQPGFMFYAVNKTTNKVIDFSVVSEKSQFQFIIPNLNYTLALTRIPSTLPSATQSSLLRLPFLQCPSQIPLGFQFDLSQQAVPLSLSCSTPTSINITFPYITSYTDSLFESLSLFLVTASLELDSTRDKFIQNFESIEWDYTTMLWRETQVIKLKYDTVVLDSDGSAAPLDLERRYEGYKLDAQDTMVSFEGKVKELPEEIQITKTNMNTKQILQSNSTFQSKTSFVLTRSNTVTQYTKSTVKVDEFVGNLGGVFFFGLYFVSIIGGFFNRIKMECNLANIFEKERLNFRWKYVFLSMFPGFIKKCFNRCHKIPPIGKYKQKGQQLLQLDELCKRIDKLQKYSMLSATPLQKQFSKIYVKQLLSSQPIAPQSTISMRSTLSYPSSISSNNSRILQREQNYKDVIVRNDPEQQAGKFPKFWQTLSFFDMLDSRVHMHFKGKSKVSSGCTQILSILLIVLLFVLFREYLRNYVENGRSNIQQVMVPANSYSISPQFLNQFKLGLNFRSVVSGQMVPIPEFLMMKLYASGEEVPFQTTLDRNNSNTILFNRFSLSGNLNKTFLNLQLFLQEDTLELAGNYELKYNMSRYEMQLCITNFKFNQSCVDQVASSFDCSQLFSIPYYIKSETVIPIRNIEQRVGDYKMGLFKSQRSSQYYTVDFKKTKKRVSIDQDETWRHTFTFQFADQKTQYTATPSNLDAVVNKLTGVIGFCIFFLIYLRLINKTKFVLELSEQLYLTEHHNLSFCDCLKVTFFLYTPSCCTTAFASPRTQSLITLYHKTFKQISFTNFLVRIRSLQDKIFNNLQEKAKSTLKIHLKSEVWKQDNLDAARDREIRTWKRQLQNQQIYKALKKKLGMTEDQAITVMEVLGNQQLVGREGLRRKLATLKSQLH